MSGVRGWPIALAVVSLTPLSLFCVCGLLFPTAVVTLLPSPASSDSTLAGVGCCVAALLAPAGGLRVGLWVCSVVFGCSRAVMSDRFSLASLLLFWPFCWLSGRDLLGFFGLCLLVFLGCWLPSLNLGCMKPKVNPGQKNKTKQILKKKKKIKTNKKQTQKLTSMLLIGSWGHSWFPFSLPFRAVFCLFHVLCPVFLFIPSVRNKIKYVYSLFPELDVIGKFLMVVFRYSLSWPLNGLVSSTSRGGGCPLIRSFHCALCCSFVVLITFMMIFFLLTCQSALSRPSC